MRGNDPALVVLDIWVLYLAVGQHSPFRSFELRWTLDLSERFGLVYLDDGPGHVVRKARNLIT